MYFESGPGRRGETVRDAVRRGNLIRLRNMKAVPGRPSDVLLFYAQSASLVDYMMRELGRDRMTSLLQAINDGTDIDEAIPLAYGMTLEELESSWKVDVAGETPLAPRPDPGTVGISALVGGAITVAIIVTAVRWFKQLIGR